MSHPTLEPRKDDQPTLGFAWDRETRRVYFMVITPDDHDLVDRVLEAMRPYATPGRLTRQLVREALDDLRAHGEGMTDPD
jgi:hypothetical protein